MFLLRMRRRVQSDFTMLRAGSLDPPRAGSTPSWIGEKAPIGMTVLRRC